MKMMMNLYRIIKQKYQIMLLYPIRNQKKNNNLEIKTLLTKNNTNIFNSNNLLYIMKIYDNYENNSEDSEIESIKMENKSINNNIDKDLKILKAKLNDLNI